MAADGILVLPRDWTPRQKWLNVVLISFQAAFTPITATMLAAGSDEIAKDLKLTGRYTGRLPVALYVLALGLGPLFLGPLSEMYGRRIIYIVNFSLFALFNLGCGFAPTITALATLRFFAGLAGSAATTLSGASVGDMFEPSKRAKAQAIYGAAPLLGPVIGGILGGYIVNGTGSWRWTMWIMTICPSLSVVTCIFFLRETYAPYLLRKYGITDNNGNTPAPPSKQRFANNLLRPLRFLVLSPICTIMAFYVGFGYGIFYFHIVTVPLVFGPAPVGNLFSYRWAAANTGLAYLGLGTGSIIGIILGATMMNRSYRFVLGRMKETSRIQALEDCPEARLPFMGIALILTPIGLIIFAWTVSPHVHWIVPLIGAAMFSAGMVMAYISIQNYLVDSFGDYAASALAAVALLRSPLACTLALLSFEAYIRLNYNWGTMLLAFILIAMLPAPVILWFHGKRLRATTRMS